MFKTIKVVRSGEEGINFLELEYHDGGTMRVEIRGIDEIRQIAHVLKNHIELHDDISSFRKEWNEKECIAYQNSVAHGFWDENFNGAEKICLMHSELSEALEAFRKSNPPSEHIPEFSGMEEEFADTVIRIMDLSAYLDLDIAGAIEAKMKFNESRPYKHGKAF